MRDTVVIRVSKETLTKLLFWQIVLGKRTVRETADALIDEADRLLSKTHPTVKEALEKIAKKKVS